MLSLIVLHNVRTIQLTRGKVALIDEADHEAVSARKWHATPGQGGKKFYANTCVGRSLLGMHRFLTNAEPGMLVDHKNRDSLDNRRENLRVCTSGQNQTNGASRGGKSRYKGVTMGGKKGSPSRPWEAYIRPRKNVRYLGSFATEEEAARAYDAAAREEYGEFALTNADLFGNY